MGRIKTRLLSCLLALVTASRAADATDRAMTADFFESRIRPLFVERCYKCHSGQTPKAGLRLDARERILAGGESGAAIVVGKPEESLLIRAVRHDGGLEMPPDGKLSAIQILDLAAWIQSGAVWPDRTVIATVDQPPVASPVITPVSPNSASLASSLQLWLPADSLLLNDGEAVHVWPDHSGHGRDVAATKGIRSDGVGLPGQFIKESSLLKRPGVRFDPTTGMASSPDNPVAILGDAALTIMLVLNLQPHQSDPPYDGVIGLGNPAHPGSDPGRPLAALVQINRGEDHSLHFAGGWNHDAALGAGSFKPLYGQTLVLTVTKQPGPMRSTTHFFINGEAALDSGSDSLAGRDTVPDIQHRSDIGAYLGKAVSWAGAIQGDLGEVVVYNRALSNEERLGVEAYLAEKFGLLLKPVVSLAPAASFTEREKKHWAYQPVRVPEYPEVADAAWSKSPLDLFILRAMKRHGTSPAAAADKRILLRRVTFDLIGLPPTPVEMDAFLVDESPQAWEHVVDRLLASPHYGERWGRHWLDVVRYAETTANDANAVMRYAWRYRNYVIDAFNSDLPYDQFLIEQLAGDLLPNGGSPAENARCITATGYLMIGPKALAETDKEQSRLDIVDDQIDVTGRAMLGLTLACARCHDHKFDAIRTADYYALAGIFRSTEPFQNENRNATMWWEFPVPGESSAEPITVMAPKDSLPRSLRVHLRGNRFNLGAIVPRGVPRVIGSLSNSTEDHEQLIGLNQPTSGRLELARWIASPANPLTARVMVNRIWQHHFGRGLVATSDDFGARGERPTHPELLDWLAAQFVADGWSVKRLQRLIVTSQTYQQGVRTRQSDSDPNNSWLSSFARRRLSAEELRDAMLAISGNLDPGAGTSESGEFLFSRAEDIKALIRPNRVASDDPFYTQFAKRSVYLPVVRNMLPDMLALFDAADPNGVTPSRTETTVASQSLFLLNSSLVREQARGLAERLLAEPKWSDEARIVRAHLLVFGREPTSSEQSAAREFLADYQQAPAAQARPESDRRVLAWQSYCQTLFCSNEFLYVE